MVILIVVFHNLRQGRLSEPWRCRVTGGEENFQKFATETETETERHRNGNEAWL